MAERPSRYSYKSLLLFSLPSILSSVMEPLASMVDSALVGHKDTYMLSSLGIGLAIINSLTWVFNFLVHNSTQWISAKRGQTDLLRPRIKISLTLALVVGVLALLFIWPLKDLLYQFADCPPELIPLVNDYFYPRLFFQPLILIVVTLLSILRGLEWVRLAFAVVCLTTVCNVILSAIFLYGADWGLAGVAYGTIISQALAFFFMMVFLVREDLIGRDFFRLKTKASDWFHFGKNSWDLFGRSLILTLAFFFSTKVAAREGVLTLAAHQVMLQIWLFSSFFLDGVAITGNVYISQLKASGDVLNRKLVSNRLLRIGIAIGLMFSLAFFLFPSYFLNFFTSDEKIHALILPWWIWPVIVQVPNAIAYVYDGLIFGLGDFAYLRKAMFFGLLFVFAPGLLMAYQFHSLQGIWVAMMALNCFRVATGVFYIHRSAGSS